MEERKSILEGITEHDVVTVKSPFDDPFDVKLARSVTGNRPVASASPTGNPTADSFMGQLNNGIVKGGHDYKVHVQQTITFQPGQVLRLPGDVARVAVNQMVREYMQRVARKQKATTKAKNVAMLMADSTAYMDAEKLIVQHSESLLSSLSVETAEQRLQRQLDELNPQQQTQNVKAEDEQPFPTEPGATNAPSPAKRAKAASRGQKN